MITRHHVIGAAWMLWTGWSAVFFIAALSISHGWPSWTFLPAFIGAVWYEPMDRHPWERPALLALHAPES